MKSRFAPFIFCWFAVYCVTREFTSAAESSQNGGVQLQGGLNIGLSGRSGGLLSSLTNSLQNQKTTNSNEGSANIPVHQSTSTTTSSNEGSANIPINLSESTTTNSNKGSANIPINLSESTTTNSNKGSANIPINLSASTITNSNKGSANIPINLSASTTTNSNKGSANIPVHQSASTTTNSNKGSANIPINLSESTTTNSNKGSANIPVHQSASTTTNSNKGSANIPVHQSASTTTNSNKGSANIPINLSESTTTNSNKGSANIPINLSESTTTNSNKESANIPVHQSASTTTNSNEGSANIPINLSESTTTNTKFSSVASMKGNFDFSKKKKQGNDLDDSDNEEEEIKEEEEESTTSEEQVCYEPLGCFSMKAPWVSLLRPIYAPLPPENISTTLFFYSRENMKKAENITLHPDVNVSWAKFDPRKQTVIMVHGFASSGNATWLTDLKDVYLKHVDANVIIVDWGKGAQLSNYLQVAGNTRVVGKQLGMFVKNLKNNYSADIKKVHLIGHSLGAHICSYLAKEVSGIAHLTALDPAQPGFEGFDKEVRLDPSDADFVDVVHTDSKPFLPTFGLGMITPHGHVDLYMNGGFEQPGCITPAVTELPSIKSINDLAKVPVEVISKIVSCPHGRAYEYLIEAFNDTEKCIFWGHTADITNVIRSVTNTLTQGLLQDYIALSSTCSKEDCIPLGFDTPKSKLRGSFVVTTSAKKPYCIPEPGIPPESPSQSSGFFQNIYTQTASLFG